MTEIKSSDQELEQRLVALTRDLILIPSIPSRPDDMRRCFELIKNHCEALDHIELTIVEHEGKLSLMAMPRECVHLKVLMIGHLDVVAHPDVSVYRSRQEGGRIYGPGAGDMKGSLAMILEVFREVHSRWPRASLGIVITSDEESGGEAGVGFLVREKGLHCELALIPDGGSLTEVTVAEKGIFHCRLKAEGFSAHSARPWEGKNALEELVAVVNQIKAGFKAWENHSDHWHPTCAVTLLSTPNQQINRVPDRAEAVLDIRFPEPFTVEGMKEHLQKVVAPFSVQFEEIISAEPTDLAPDPVYMKSIETITGIPPRCVKDDGGSDARFLAARGIPVQVSRPLVGNLHAVDEWIDIASLVSLYRIYENYLTTKLGLHD